jgi:hypothetical protein
MAQQINLVNPALRPKREALTAAHMAWALAGLALLLGGYAEMLNLQLAEVTAQRAQWAGRLQQAQDGLMQAMQQYPVRQPSAALQAEIAATEARLEQLGKVMEILDARAIGTPGGFSGLMQAFAHVGMRGVWLTGFSANGRGDEMRIGGRALAPDLIPQYIGRLSSEPALRGRTFSALKVSQPSAAATAPAGQQGAAEPASGFVEFSLSADKPPQAVEQGATTGGARS